MFLTCLCCILGICSMSSSRRPSALSVILFLMCLSSLSSSSSLSSFSSRSSSSSTRFGNSARWASRLAFVYTAIGYTSHISICIHTYKCRLCLFLLVHSTNYSICKHGFKRVCFWTTSLGTWETNFTFCQLCVSAISPCWRPEKPEVHVRTDQLSVVARLHRSVRNGGRKAYMWYAARLLHWVGVPDI